MVTASPYMVFKETYDKLENSIRERYPDHRLVPFAIGQQLIDGLRVRYSDAEVCNVHMAIFDDYIQPRNNFRFTQGLIVDHTRGDVYYGMDSWLK